MKLNGFGGILIFFSIALLVLIPIWMLLVAPYLIKIPDDFRYSVDIISKDNFYDASTGSYSGEIGSDTFFSYEVISRRKNNVLLIKNLFDVRSPSGAEIFSVERIYGIDRKTGMHVAGYGDKDREGYLLAPRHMKRGQDYTYWHINYDTPAQMLFQGEEIINGLKVYRYKEEYHADQTEDLTHLPNVGVTRGINLDIDLQTWVEPVSGRLVKYEDNTIAYYYDLHTRNRIHPWNKFSNRYSRGSVMEQVRFAKIEKQRILLIGRIIPLLFAVVIFAIFLSLSLTFEKNPPRVKNKR